MMSVEMAGAMARYNRWQNNSLFGAADILDDAARTLDRGAFFGSIHATLSHLAWGDTIWMSRFDGWTAPDVGIPGSAAWMPDWAQLVEYRQGADTRIIDWADRMTEDTLRAPLTWFSGATGKEHTKPLGLCVAHFFNHQTHHRGQVHAMLTAAGAKPEATDLFIMPDDG